MSRSGPCPCGSGKKRKKCACRRATAAAAAPVGTASPHVLVVSQQGGCCCADGLCPAWFPAAALHAFWLTPIQRILPFSELDTLLILAGKMQEERDDVAWFFFRGEPALPPLMQWWVDHGNFHSHPDALLVVPGAVNWLTPDWSAGPTRVSMTPFGSTMFADFGRHPFPDRIRNMVTGQQLPIPDGFNEDLQELGFLPLKP